MTLRNIVPALALLCVLTVWGPPRAVAASDAPVPRYTHIVVIVAENKSYLQIIGNPAWAPDINRLAGEYGLATHFYAEVHPSEANYIAMVGGDTFGIHDDDAYYCRPALKDTYCPKSGAQGYAVHSIRAESLLDQLDAAGLTWKGYFEDIPLPGSLTPRWPEKAHPLPGRPAELYAAKHNGFVSFAKVNEAPEAERAKHMAGFDALESDLAAGHLANYVHIVPNQCNEMHGLGGPDVPEDCRSGNDEGLVRRGDAMIGRLVTQLQGTAAWNGPENMAIIITFDEGGKLDRQEGPQGCCGYDPESAANFGGGHIPTVVITNHGPRHLADPTPYNHYSLLRTTEAAFGMGRFLGHAAEESKGVVTMAPLFAVRP